MHPIKRQKKICSVKKQLRETRFRGKNCEDMGHLVLMTPECCSHTLGNEQPTHVHACIQSGFMSELRESNFFLHL